MTAPPEPIDARANGTPNPDGPRRPAAGGSGGMLGLFVVLVVPAFLLGLLTGAGPAAIVGAFAGLFSFIGVAGGPLWPDLRTLALSSPLLLVAACGPRLLAEVSRPAAFVLILALVLVAALLPLRRPGLTTTGLGLGLLTLISYGLPVTGPVQAVQLVVATSAGLVVAALFRLLIGIADPHGPTRAKVAALFDRPDASVTDALDPWLRDGRPTWLAEVSVSALRARSALTTAEACVRRLPKARREHAEAALERLRARADRTAESIRAKRPPADPDVAGSGGTGPVGHDDLAARLALAEEALAHAEQLAVRRDTTPAVTPAPRRRQLRRALSPTGGAWRSAQVRHALRTTLGVLLALLLSLSLRPGDALLTTLLMTTFSILQTSWTATLARARPKVAGLLVGALLTIAIVVLIPDRFGLPIALIALVVGLANITSRPVLGNAAMVCVSVGFNGSLRHLDPLATLGEYAVLVVAAVLIALVAGFGVIPRRRSPTLRRRLDTAVSSTVDSVRSLLDDHGTAERMQAERSRRTALHARRELLPDHDHLTDDQQSRLARLRTGLDDFAALAVLSSPSPRADTAAVTEACDRLEHGSSARRPVNDDALLPVLADEIRQEWSTLREELQESPAR